MQTHPTPYPTVNAVLSLILSRMQAILGDKLVGLYIFGSLVTGDFEVDSSDIDLVAATSTGLDKEALERLKTMHDEIALQEKVWDDRIEVAYISLGALRRYQPRYRLPLISPGEPFHVTEAGPDWVLNRYVLREKGMMLFGPSPKTLIDPISPEERLQALQALMKEWRDWIKQTEALHRRSYQAYAILTMCRALYTLKRGDFVSKKQAALWAEQELPERSSLIQRALVWRADWRNGYNNADATLEETLDFIHFVLGYWEGPGR